LPKTATARKSKALAQGDRWISRSAGHAKVAPKAHYL